ncbi:MAG: hypothetical protein WBD09_02190 [Halobacteriota archaeon]
MKEPYGMSYKQIAHRLGGKFYNDYRELKKILVFLADLGAVHPIYDAKFGTTPSPIMWECNEKRVKEILRMVRLVHNTLGNGGLEGKASEVVYRGYKAIGDGVPTGSKSGV